MPPAKKRGGRPAWRVRWWIDDGDDQLGETEVRGINTVGDLLAIHIAEEKPYIVTIEGLYLDKRDRSGRALERLSWAAGCVGGPSLRYAANASQIDSYRPRARGWRPQVLGIAPNTKGPQASAMALELVPRLVHGFGELARIEHVCEAAAIALWGRQKWNMAQR